MVVGLGCGGCRCGGFGNLGVSQFVVVAQVEGDALFLGQAEDSLLQSDGLKVGVVYVAVVGYEVGLCLVALGGVPLAGFDDA